MKTERQDKYSEWLQVIVNTRLMHNHITELEDFLGNHAIHNNGIKRIYNSLPKIRSAFRDFKVEASLTTDELISLDEFLVDYEQASIFYTKHLARRSERISLAKQLLQFHYEPHQTEGVQKRILSLFQLVESCEIDTSLLILLLLDAIPGYESKDGDVANIDVQWCRVMDFLDDFTKGCGNLVESIPAIAKAREENNKCRLMLVYHTRGILDIYESYADSNALYATSSELKARRVNLDIAGYWNECEGRADDTSFWKIEETIDNGLFFATWWQKNADNQLVKIRYSLNLIVDDDEKLVAYMQHPDAIMHRVNGLKYNDSDHAWYKSEMPDEFIPAKLSFIRSFPSNYWKPRLTLTRVTDQHLTTTYDRWINNCEIENPHKSSEYEFYYKLYGITHEALYIYDDIIDMYYKVPRGNKQEFYKIGLNDNVGIMVIDGKRYLAFDDLMLYISINDDALSNYGITIVNEIV